MKFKRIIILTCVVLIITSALMLCACKKDEEGYTLVVPDGAPALAIARVSDEILTDSVVYKLNKKIVPASTVNAEALKSDIAIVPANLASILYNGGNDFKILAVVTNGNLFLMSSQNKKIESLDALKGKLVYSIGQNSVPDIIFKTLLKNNGINFKVGEKAEEGAVTIKYCADGSEVNSALILAKEKGEQSYGVYAEPDVNKGKSAGLTEAFDIQKMWSEDTDDAFNGYAQAVLIAKSNVCEDSRFVAKLLEELQANKSRIMQDAQLAEDNIKSIYPQTSLKGNLNSDVIARCNIDCISMKDGRDYYEKTLRAVMNINPKLIGGELPDDGFYYIP